jgi:hypothetical protein
LLIPLRFKEQEQLIQQLNATLSREQQAAMRKYGYTQMNNAQLEMVYNEKGFC